MSAAQNEAAAQPTHQDHRPLRLGVLISGSGTNLQAIIDRIAAGTLDAEVAIVISSRPSALGLKRAEAAGIQTMTLSKDIYADPITADEVIASTLRYADPDMADVIIANELRKRGVDYVIMAGYMRMVHAPLLASFPNRIVNIHPALLPSFKGAHGIQDAYDYGVKVTGVTVHFADDKYDCGPIIAQRALAIDESWSVDELEEHIHAIEHELYPDTIQLLAEGRVSVRDDGTVAIAPAS